VSDDRVARDESLRVVAVVGKARQSHRPIWSDQAESVPTTAPGVGYAPALQHHVVEARLGEFVAEREAGLTAAHDDDLVVRQGPVDLTPRIKASGSPALGNDQEVLVRDL